MADGSQASSGVLVLTRRVFYAESRRRSRRSRRDSLARRTAPWSKTPPRTTPGVVLHWVQCRRGGDPEAISFTGAFSFPREPSPIDPAQPHRDAPAARGVALGVWERACDRPDRSSRRSICGSTSPTASPLTEDERDARRGAGRRVGAARGADADHGRSRPQGGDRRGGDGALRREVRRPRAHRGGAGLLARALRRLPRRQHRRDRAVRPALRARRGLGSAADRGAHRRRRARLPAPARRRARGGRDGARCGARPCRSGARRSSSGRSGSGTRSSRRCGCRWSPGRRPPPRSRSWPASGSWRARCRPRRRRSCATWRTCCAPGSAPASSCSVPGSEGKVTLIAAVTEDLKARVPAGKLLKALAGLIGGSGGGKDDFAQAGGKEPERLPEALAGVARAVAELAGGEAEAGATVSTADRLRGKIARQVMRKALGMLILLAATPPAFGGSTTIQVREDGMKVIVNEPSEARSRRLSGRLLAVPGPPARRGDRPLCARARPRAAARAGAGAGRIGIQPQRALEQGRDRPDAAHAGNGERPRSFGSLGHGAESARRHRLPAADARPLRRDRARAGRLQCRSGSGGEVRWRSRRTKRPATMCGGCCTSSTAATARSTDVRSSSFATPTIAC